MNLKEVKRWNNYSFSVFIICTAFILFISHFEVCVAIVTEDDITGSYWIGPTLLNAEENLNNGLWQKAFQNAQQALSQDYGNIMAHAFIGTVYAVTGRKDEAEKKVTLLQKVDPENPYLYLIQGILAAQEDEFEKSQNFLSKVLKIEPENSVAGYYMARVNFLRGNISQAEEEFKEVLESNPQFVPALAGLGDVYTKKNQTKKAIQSYKKAVEIQPDNILYHRQLISLYKKTGQQEKEKKELQSMLHRIPGVKVSYLQRAMQLLLEGSYQNAVELVDKGFQNYENFADGYYVKAVAFINMGKKEEALQELKKYIEALSQSPQAQYYAGMCYLVLEDFEKAREHFNEAKNINPKFSRGIVNLTVIEQVKGNYDVAIENLESSGLSEESSSLYHYLMAHFLMAKGDKDEYEHSIRQTSKLIPGIDDERISLTFLNVNDAISLAKERNLMLILFLNGWYEMAIKKSQSILEINEKDIFALYFKSLAQKSQRKNTHAIENLQEILKVEPNLIAAYMELGSLNMQTNQREKGFEAFQKAVEINPQYAQAHIALGMYHLSQRNTEKAIKEFKKVIKLDPNYPQVHRQLALIYTQEDRSLEDALTLASRAVELEPMNPMSLDTLGWVYIRLDNKEKAIEKLSEAVTIAPENPIIRYHLGIAYYNNNELKKAKSELEKALDISKEFPGSSHASELLKKITS